MEKETSCINSRAILNYLKEHNVDCSILFGDLDPEIDGLEDPEKFLRDPNNWISSTVISKLFKRAKLILHDEKVAYKMGRYASENISLGYAQRIVFKSFWSTRKVLKNAQKINDQWNRSKKVELIELKKNQAILRLHWNPEMEVTKDICLYNQGAYTYLPLVWGGRPVALKETCCYFDGAPYCEYHLKWPFTNKFDEIFSRFFTSKSVLMATIKEMERDKKIIEEKTENLKNEIEERKQAENALRESERKLSIRNKITEIFLTIPDDEMYGEVLQAILEFTESKYGIFGYIDEHGVLVIPSMTRDIWEQCQIPDKTIIYPPETWGGIWGRALMEKRGRHANEGLRVPEGHVPVTKVVVMPIMYHGDVIGLLEIANKEKDYNGEDQELLKTIADHIAPILQARLQRDRQEKDRKQAEESLRKSEEKLARSRKMESLGLLAGGVAHDLNNVLSGIVSYPDLLLMDLPENSKLRKPIETMQESGHRAAAIVQDLLTVARGIATTKEPLNLNDIVRDYLVSPEFKKLTQFHPPVTVTTNLAADLLNTSGSHVHIRKVVMNLVSNASEAIAGNGNVTISTMNRYIDRPLRGYDEVTIGEYAVLAISDDGSGISSDDIERIFEPFYTKKVMSRSGTGLGLAVVWNIVQDHKGYIDVISDENGTTFELYFPITREELSEKALSIPIKEYKGSGETVLVVDDVESQREISCNMLDALGYKTKAISSGEEAVEYLKEHTVDLLLLDMIMDPGIDGRETYERIIKIHPHQKAIIVSGFAETDVVKKTQKLGAGKYIKKPITLEKLGLAVKEELDR